MDMLETLLAAQGGGAVNQVAQKFGLEQGQAQSAIEALLPALAGGLRNNVSQQGGLESLLGALGGGQHQQYLENPELLNDPSTVEDGNSILGHILGSKDVSRQVAAQASAQTGIGTDILKQMLPVVATMVMGAMSQRASATSEPASQAQGILGMLSPMLDSNRDGSVADDVLGMAMKFFQR
jgi:hypothetical protein